MGFAEMLGVQSHMCNSFFNFNLIVFFLTFLFVCTLRILFHNRPELFLCVFFLIVSSDSFYSDTCSGFGPELDYQLLWDHQNTTLQCHTQHLVWSKDLRENQDATII